MTTGEGREGRGGGRKEGRCDHMRWEKGGEGQMVLSACCVDLFFSSSIFQLYRKLGLPHMCTHL